MSKNERYINPNSIVNVTANDFETYEEALSHGRKIASEYHMVIDKFNNE